MPRRKQYDEEDEDVVVDSHNTTKKKPTRTQRFRAAAKKAGKAAYRAAKPEIDEMRKRVARAIREEASAMINAKCAELSDEYNVEELVALASAIGITTRGLRKAELCSQLSTAIVNYPERVYEQLKNASKE